MDRTKRTLVMLVAVVLATVAGGGLVAGSASSDASNSTGAAVQADCSYPVSVTDTTGTNVTLEERPERIVVLQPSDAQIVWSLNASDRVVGMPQGPATGYLNDTANVTNVKNQDGSVDVEQVTNLSADLVLAANVTGSSTIDQLRNTDTPVYHFGLVTSMNETYRNINRTGQLVGNCAAAGETVASMRQRLDRIERAVAGAEEPRVLYAFYGYSAGNNTHVNSMIEAAGGENIVATAGESGYPEISQEIVAANDPQWIVYPSDAQPPSGAPYNDTTALQQDQVLKVNTNFINQAGPRNVEVVETMAQQFHPEAFDENGEPIVETATPTATETVTETVTDTDATTATEGSGPGFTPAAVAVALVGALVALGVRRKGV